ncbi:MAG TPA: MarR family transcriptional regulator [Terriglobales bacterium]
MTAAEKSLIQAELKQTKPFRNLEQEAYLALQRTADELQSRATEMLKPYGISPTQFNVLRILRGAEPKGHKCGEIGDRMVKRDPDITRLLDRMERAGFITRTRDVRDRRVVVTRITQKGLDLLRKLDRPIDDFGRELLGHLGERQLKVLVKLLDEARAGRKK